MPGNNVHRCTGDGCPLELHLKGDRERRAIGEALFGPHPPHHLRCSFPDQGVRGGGREAEAADYQVPQQLLLPLMRRAEE